MDTEIQSSLLEAMGQMGENEFTQKIIQPLFKTLGYEWSQFNGGSYEEGVDHFAFKHNDLDDSLYLICIQSKKIDNSQKTKPRAELSDIIHQLRQCLMNQQRLPNGQYQIANEAYLAIPGELNPRLRNEIFGQLEYGQNKVKLLEGPKIIQILQTKAPKVLECLSQHPSFITRNASYLNASTPLAKALYVSSTKNLTDIYSDLEFFIGQRAERSLITDGYSELKKVFKCEEKDIIWFKNLNEVAIESWGIPAIGSDIGKKLSEYQKQRELYSSTANEKAQLKYQEAIRDQRAQITVFEQRITDALYNRVISQEESKLLHSYLNYWEQLDDYQKTNKNLISKIDGGEILQTNISNRIKSINDSFTQLVTQPELHLKFCLKFISQHLEKRVLDHLEYINLIETGKADQSIIYKFLENAETLLKMQGQIFESSSPLISQINKTKFKTIDNIISFSPSIIFDSGKDIALFGGAGFGKTTTLQSYAARCLASPKKKCVFIELAKYKESFKKQIGNDIDYDINGDTLLKCILDSFKCETSETNVIELKRVLNDSPLLLDGIDEIYSYIPLIIKTIKKFKAENPNCQVIISSRDSAEYLSEIEFLGISLLPFNQSKLRIFISKWLNNEELSNKLWKTIKKKEIVDLLCNPLLATIACSLVEQGLEIPNSESDLYKKRLQLLTGDYDFHRGVKRQSSPPEFLQELAMQSAMIFHEKQVRTLDFSLLKKYLINLFKTKYTQEKVLNGLSELVDPCNILILNDIDKTVTFGHFRFQESLVAQLLSTKQIHEILQYLHITFWQGAFILLAEQKVVDGILEECLRSDTFDDNYILTLSLMIRNTPVTSNTKEGYREIINMLSNK